MNKTLQEQMADAARGALGTGIEGNAVATTKVAQRYALEQQVLLLTELGPHVKVLKGDSLYERRELLKKQLEELK